MKRLALSCTAALGLVGSAWAQTAPDTTSGESGPPAVRIGEPSQWFGGEIDGVIDLRDLPGNFDQSSWGQPNTTIYAQSVVADDAFLNEFRFRATPSDGDLIFNVIVTGARADGGGGLGLAPCFADTRYNSGQLVISGGLTEITVNPDIPVTPGETLFFVLDTFSYPNSGIGTVRATEFNGQTDQYPPGEFVFLNTSDQRSLLELDALAFAHRFDNNEDLAILAVFKSDDPCDDCPCPEDINRDGVVDFADILRILAAWGPCDDNVCDFPGVCGQFERCGVGEPFDCFCWTLIDGSGACYQDFPCNDVIDCPDGNCPPGFVCVVQSCCEVNKCVPMIKCDERAYPLFEGATGLTGSGAMIEPSTPEFGAMLDLGPQRRGDLELPAGPHDIVGLRQVEQTVATDEVAFSEPGDEEATRTFGHTGRNAPDFGDTTLIDPDGRTIETVQIGLDGFSGSENIITFDELGGNVPPAGPFSINDVTFSEVSSGSGGPGWRLLSFDYDGPPTPPILTDNAGISDIRIAFDTPQDRAGVFVGIAAMYELQVYDASGNLLETARVVTTDAGDFLGFENFAGISLLRVIEPSGENARVGGIDDVHYERLPRDEKWCNGPYNCEIDTCWFSTRNSDVNPFIRYDDFVCPEESLVGSFEFIAGGWLDGPCDLLSNLAAVEISIYEWRQDEVCGWAPGALICTNVVRVEDMDIERLCVDQFGIQQYQFSGLLPEPCLWRPVLYAILIAGVVADPNGCFMCWAATSQPRRCLGYSVDQINGGCISNQDMVFCIDTVDPCDDCPCPEDINRDGVVDFADILRVLAAWGPCEEECDDCEDGFVDRCGGTDACHVCLTPDGRCVCVIESACDDNFACPEGDCPPGFFCCVNTCCGFPICLPVCEVADGAVPQFEPGVRTSGGAIR